MRPTTFLMAALLSLLALAKPASLAGQTIPVAAPAAPVVDHDLAKARAAAAEARQAAAAQPTIQDAKSPPVVAYLAEQKLRRLNRLVRLRQQIEQLQGDASQASLLPVLRQQLSELESKPPEQVAFDAAYGYQPSPGLVGYSKKVRLVENTQDGKSVILVDNAALVLEGLGTSQYVSGKFLGVDKAILIGSPAPDYNYRGSMKKSYSAMLVDLESLLKAGPGGKTGGPVEKTAGPREKAGPLVLDVWPGKAADDVGIPGEEHFRELNFAGKAHEMAGKPTKWLTDVTRPTLTIYRPAKDKNTGVAMLICPGGGYHNLGWDVEGEEVAAWLNSIGITGIILKYRCPRRPGDVKGLPPDGPLKDAQRAVSLVRGKAAEWDIDPSKIGMVGFSAGGHLVGSTATRFEQRTYESIDDVDKISCRPDFAVMLYSGYFKLNDQGDLSPTVRAIATAPPLLFIHSSDDPISAVDHSVTMYLAMKRAGARSEMHVYASGGHGFGVRDIGHPCVGWTSRCVDWLRDEKFLSSSSAH